MNRNRIKEQTIRQLPSHHVEQLSHLISSHYPNQAIMHISDGSCDLHQALYTLTQKRGFSYDLMGIGWQWDGPDSTPYPGFCYAPFDLARPKYNRHAKTYDNLFVTLAPKHLDGQIVPMLKKIYRIMKNGGIVTFLIDPNAPLAETLPNLLEEGYFVAINRIDIFDDLDVISAKKMHGWGAYSVGF